MFLVHVFSHFNYNCPIVDVVFDRCRNTSIKSGTRTKREGQMHSIHRKIHCGDIPLAAYWKQFMDLPENKANLTCFLITKLMIEARKTHPARNVITAGGFEEQTAVASIQESDVHPSQSSHEEADTRIILDVNATYRGGYDRVIVSCRDTDVLVLITHFAGKLSREMWRPAFTRQHIRYIVVHNIGCTPMLHENILSYHAVTGFDTALCEEATAVYLHSQLSVENPLPKEFPDILYCKCKHCTTARCSCRAMILKCTGTCACHDGICHNPYSVIELEG